MNRYNREELADMIFILGEAGRNYLLASRIYAQRYHISAICIQIAEV